MNLPLKALVYTLPSKYQHDASNPWNHVNRKLISFSKLHTSVDLNSNSNSHDWDSNFPKSEPRICIKHWTHEIWQKVRTNRTKFKKVGAEPNWISIFPYHHQQKSPILFHSSTWSTTTSYTTDVVLLYIYVMQQVLEQRGFEQCEFA